MRDFNTRKESAQKIRNNLEPCSIISQARVLILLWDSYEIQKYVG